MKVAYDHGFRLRIDHGDRAEVRLSWAGRPVVFDPATEPGESDLVILTGPSPDRMRATAAALKSGRRLHVVASDEAYDWLVRLGPIEGGPAPRTVDGIQIQSMRYEAPPEIRPLPRRLVGYVGALRPGAALRHLRERAELPDGPPHVWHLRFPDGGRLLHLDLALHPGQSGDWVDRAAAAFGGADWVVVGNQYQQGEGLRRWLHRFGGRVLLADLVNDERRARGLPTELLTPVRDELVAAGVDTHVFATQTSYRFE